MRYSNSLPFALAKNAHAEAYRLHDRFAEAGDDDSASARRASEAEYVALDAVMLTPCRHPLDVADKLDLYARRSFADRTDGDLVIASLQRDLRDLARPSASEAMKLAWIKWASVRLAYETQDDIDDKTADAICAAHFAEHNALMKVPCTTAGDFLVKSYVGLLEDCQSTVDRPGGFAFEMREDWRQPATHYMEDDVRAALIDDLDNCDLGRCMAALGDLDFDPSSWVTAAQRAGLTVTLMIEADGRRHLYIGESLDDEPSGIVKRRRNRVRALLNFDDARVHDVKVEIEHFFPRLVSRYEQPIAEAARQQVAA